jgi:hypothetical protein
VVISEGAVVGPDACVEEGSILQPGAEVRASYVGPYTLVGKYTRIGDSLVCGPFLANWRTGSWVQVPDRYLLARLRRPHGGRRASWLRRAADLYTRNKEDLQMFCKHLLMNKEG